MLTHGQRNFKPNWKNQKPHHTTIILQKTACIFAKNQKIQKLQIVMVTKTERLKFISAKPEKLN